MITSISTITRNPAVVGDGLMLPAAIALVAPYAPSGPATSATSNSMVSIGLGPKAFVVQRDLGFQYGMRVRAVVDGVGAWMEGVISSYSDDDLVITCDLLSSAGTYDDWLINVTGQPGKQGNPGPQGVQGEPGILEEAPIDGGIYGRQNGNWAPAGIGALTAAGVASTPAGDIAATNVQAALNELDLEKLAKAGGTMTGHLFLPTAPAAANAVRKDYVDAGDAAITTAKVAKAGDTMTGHLALPVGPAAANAVRRDYVDSVNTALTTAIADKVGKGGDVMTGHLSLPTAPAAANAVRKDYVDAGDSALSAAKVAKAGDTMTGPLILAGGAPTVDQQAATKLYVDTSASAGGTVRFDSVQTLTDPQKLQARSNIYAAPFDAMAVLGMQVNGDHWVSQQHGSNVASIPVNAAIHVTDNWRFSSVGAPFGTAAQIEVVPNGCFQKSMIYIAGNAIASPAAGDAMLFDQRLDFGRTAHLGWGTAAGQPMTVAFWVQSSLTGNIPVAVRTGIGARSYITTVPISAASVYQYKTVTIPPDPSFALITDPNQQAIDISWGLCIGTFYQTAANVWTAGNFMTTPGCLNLHSAGSGHWIRITGVRYFRGLQAPTAEQSANCSRNYAEQLRECQRYYWKHYEQFSSGHQAAGLGSSSGFPFPVQMRANPAVSFMDQNYVNSSALALYYATKDMYATTFTATATGAVNIGWTVYLNSYM